MLFRAWGHDVQTAYDGPSGLDLSTGQVHAPCVRATITVSFGGFRRGHLLQRTVCGKIRIAEMGFPPADPSWPGAVTDAWLARRIREERRVEQGDQRGRYDFQLSVGKLPSDGA